MNRELIINTLAQFHTDEDGATATEYIILLILIACFVIGIVKVFGSTISQKYAEAQAGVAGIGF
jgi:Flp pilus assembly pilin Flp